METLAERLQIPRLAELCEKYGVKYLGVFGSVLREDFSDKSDIDFLVEFGPTDRYSPSKQFFHFLFELEDMYGRQVDLVSRKAIENPIFREIVEEQQVTVYAA